MPPRRRPAGAVAPKAKAKAAPRRGAVRGPRLRRPARAGEEPVRVETLEERWERGDEIEGDQIKAGWLAEGSLLVARGSYWGGACQVAGRVRSLRAMPDHTMELGLAPEGTNNEGLLRWASGHKGEVVLAHLCGRLCPNKVETEGLIHVETLRRSKTEGEEAWVENLREGPDELSRLREAGREREPDLGDPGGGAEGKEHSKKDKKVDKKEKKRKSSSGSSSESRKKKKKKKAY